MVIPTEPRNGTSNVYLFLEIHLYCSGRAFVSSCLLAYPVIQYNPVIVQDCKIFTYRIRKSRSHDNGQEGTFETFIYFIWSMLCSVLAARIEQGQAEWVKFRRIV
jgi:hypothetical protein